MDPMVILRQMALSNPQAKQILDALNKGTNPEQLFRDMCKEKGLDPDKFLQQLGYKQ